MRFVTGYGVLRKCECCFFSANLAQDLQLAATLTPDGPIQIIIDCVTPKINPFLSHPFLSHLLSLPPSGPIVPLIRLRSSSELPGAVVSRSDVREIFANQPGRPKPMLDTAPPQAIRVGETTTSAAVAQSTVEPSSSSVPANGEDGVAPLNEPRLARPRPGRHSSSPLPRNSTSARPRPASRRTQPFSSLFSRYPQTNQPMLAAPLPPILHSRADHASGGPVLERPGEQA